MTKMEKGAHSDGKKQKNDTEDHFRFLYGAYPDLFVRTHPHYDGIVL